MRKKLYALAAVGGLIGGVAAAEIEQRGITWRALTGYGVAVQMLETGLAGAGIDPFGEQTGLGQSR